MEVGHRMQQKHGDNERQHDQALDQKDFVTDGVLDKRNRKKGYIVFFLIEFKID